MSNIIHHSDLCSFIDDPDNAYKNRALWSYKRHCIQATRELRTCFSYFQGHQLKFEASHSRIMIDFKTKSKSEKIRSKNKSIKAFIHIIEEFLSWELKKIGEDIKCRIKGWGDGISITFISERIYAPTTKICEKCGKKSKTLVHYHSYGDDLFLCKECNLMYLYSADP